MSQTVRLADVCSFLDSERVPVTESDRRPGLYPYYGANGQQGSIDGYIFDEPLVLLAEDGGYFGSKTRPIAYKVSGKCWVNNHAHVLRPRQNCDVGYLHRVLSYYDVTKFVSGTTRPKLTKTQAETMPITLPALPEQKRIAAILERADRLRRLRRYALRLSDAYLQDEFVEMFGDLAQNPRRWESRALGEYVRFLTSGSRGWAAFVADDGPLFLRIQNVGNGRLLLDDIAHVRPPDTAEAGRTKVCPRDLVLSITADLGRTAVIPRGFPEAYVNQHLALARLAGVNPVFVAGYFSSKHGRAQIQRLDRAGVKSGLNFDDIRGLMVPAPPISLQDEYERIVRRYEHLRAQQREAERQAGHLFQTLLQWAFRGEL